jgi:hypothetical protein
LGFGFGFGFGFGYASVGVDQVCRARSDFTLR